MDVLLIGHVMLYILWEEGPQGGIPAKKLFSSLRNQYVALTFSLQSKCQLVL